AATSDGLRCGPSSWMATSTLLKPSSAIVCRARSNGYFPKQRVEHATITAPSVGRGGQRSVRTVWKGGLSPTAPIPGKAKLRRGAAHGFCGGWLRLIGNSE